MEPDLDLRFPILQHSYKQNCLYLVLLIISEDMEIVNLAPNRLNWLGGILIVVSCHIHFNKLLMPLMPVCCFAN